MRNLRGAVIVGVMCLVVAVGCKKKDESTPAAGSGSAGSGSVMMGSGSGSADMGSGSAAMGSGAMGSGAGSAAMGSAAGSAAAAADTAAAPPADAEGHRKWDCKKTCKLALKCKAAAGFKNEKACDQDCGSLAKDKGGKYARGSIVSAAYYTCTNKTKDCAGIKKCDHDVEHAK